MRRPFLAFTLLFAFVAMPLVPVGGHLAALTPAASVVHAQEQAPPSPAVPRADVDIDVNDAGAAWYTSPVWIAVGVIALVVLIALIVMATRGGGTTVVR